VLPKVFTHPVCSNASHIVLPPGARAAAVRLPLHAISLFARVSSGSCERRKLSGLC